MASIPLSRSGRSPTTAERAEGPAARPLKTVRRPPALNVPIAIKFAVFITVLVVLSMIWLTATAMRVAEESQDVAVNEDGTTKVLSLAALVDPAWFRSPDGPARLKDILQRYCASTRDWGVLNAMAYPADRDEALATGKSEETSFRISQSLEEVTFLPAAREGVRIQEMEYNRQPTRRFVKAVKTRGDPPAEAGRVEVLLSAQRISDSRDAIRNRMAMVSLASSLAAAVVSFLLARYLTFPVRTLAKDLRQVSLGNLDHQSKVRSGDEIGDLARTFNHMTANLRQAQEAVVAQRALEHELNLATRIQTRLLPASIPDVPGFRIAAYYRAAREVGGDYYDFITIDPDHLGLVVADVSGKGVPGSLVMTMTRSLLRMAAAGQPSPLETICQVNRVLAPDVNPGMFVTLLYFVLHVPTGRIRMVRSGHNAPLLWADRAGKLLQLQPRGIALGLDPKGALFRSELEVQQFAMKPGDFLVAYTDGIVEGKNPPGESYSDERFARIVQENARQPAEAIIDAILNDLDEHRSGAEQSDDITLLVMKRVSSDEDKG